jgi:redox-sensing transcriptional repressor
MKSEKISELTTNRLSVYLRCLNKLAAAGHQDRLVARARRTVQSQLGADQERPRLLRRVRHARRRLHGERPARPHHEHSGLDTAHRVGIVGAGHLGTALANYNGFTASNFAVVALFDNDRARIGQTVGDARH